MTPVVPQDAKVWISHVRAFSDTEMLFTRHERPNDTPLAKGGMTLVQLELADGRTIRAAARCSSRDNFCKATGRQIALGRALKEASL